MSGHTRDHVALSPRECEVITQVGYGLSDRAIGEQLSISEKHLTNVVVEIRQKLRATGALPEVADYHDTSRVVLARWAIEHGYAPLERLDPERKAALKVRIMAAIREEP
jgi:DNA-binding NarL/FixJ family response regulator